MKNFFDFHCAQSIVLLSEKEDLNTEFNKNNEKFQYNKKKSRVEKE